MKTVKKKDSMHEEEVSRWNDTYFGYIKHDRSFSMTLEKDESMNYLLGLCKRLRESTLVKGNVKCWPEQFMKYKNRKPPPVVEHLSSFTTKQTEPEPLKTGLMDWIKTSEGIKAQQDHQIFMGN